MKRKDCREELRRMGMELDTRDPVIAEALKAARKRFDDVTKTVDTTGKTIRPARITTGKNDRLGVSINSGMMQFVELLANQKGVTSNKVLPQIIQQFLYHSLSDYCHEVQKVENEKDAAEKQQTLKFDDDIPF